MKSKSTNSSKRLSRLQQKAYRTSMAQEDTMTRIAIQIRLMREKAGLSQAELAEKIGTKQGAIARLESMTYGKFSISMLQRIAEYFDVVAWVEFAPFSTFVNRTQDLSAAALTPASYDEDLGKAMPNSLV